MEGMKLRYVNVKRTGEMIDRLRLERGLTVRELMEMLGMTVQAYYKWLSGVCLPKIDVLVMLADIFGVKVDDIIVAE